MTTIQGERELKRALEAQEDARRRFAAAVGTSIEMGAYMRLRAASRRVAECDRATRRPERELELRPV
jgi:hypothetical protein